MMLLLLQKDGALLTQLPVTTNLDSEQIIPPSSLTTYLLVTVHPATYTVTVTTTTGTQPLPVMVNTALPMVVDTPLQAISVLQAGTYLLEEVLRQNLEH